jgi:hypothetical protein
MESADDDSGDQCLCQSCCSDILAQACERDNISSYLVAAVRRRELSVVAAIEYMSIDHAPAFVDAGGVDALLDLVSLRGSTYGQLAYVAARAAFAVTYVLPSSEQSDAYDARVAFATRIAAILRDCDSGRLLSRPTTFNGILCCTFEALWPSTMFEKLDIIQSTSVMALGDTGVRLRDVLFETSMLPRVLFRNLFQIVAKPRAFCQAEKNYLPDSECLHNHALPVLCKLVVGSPPGTHHHILREVPSALSILVNLIRNQNAAPGVACHAICILRELLQDEDGSSKTVREMLRLAPDSFHVLIRAMYTANEHTIPGLVDIFIMICSYCFSARGVSSFDRTMLEFVTFLEGSPEIDRAQASKQLQLASALLIRAALSSTETLFVADKLEGCASEVKGISDVLQNDPFLSRLSSEVLERTRICSRYHEGLGEQGGNACLDNGNPDVNDESDGFSGVSDCGGGLVRRREEGAFGHAWREQARLSAKWRMHACEHCGISDYDFPRPHSRCRACMRSHFCSRRHQRAAWAHGHHKSLCRAYQRLTADESLPATITHNDGDCWPPLESVAEVDEYVQQLVDRAARAGVPSNAVIIVVDMPASMHSPLALDRAEHMNSAVYDMGPGRIRVHWETPFEWIGIHRERLLSFEMCLASFPTMKRRECAIQAERQWLESTRRSWWSTDASCENRVPGAYRAGKYRCAHWEWTDMGRRVVRYRDVEASPGIKIASMSLHAGDDAFDSSD